MVDNLPTYMCRLSRNSDSLNFLEPYGSVQACTEINFPYNLPYKAWTDCVSHTPYRSQYAAIALTTPCTSFMQILLTKCVIFSQALTVAP